ncbi:MAG: ATP-binding protein [Planctomycetes bacterium]|nr:ATP-binding protein [Planctomycetota bacterium]
MKRHASNDPHELKLDLPAAHSAQRMARAVLRQFAKRERIPEKEIVTIEFIASELLSNAVDHGGGGRAMEESDLESDVRMTLVLNVRENGWTMRVSDQGGGDPDELVARLAERGTPDLEDERGRGLFLLRQMLDSLEVVRTSDGRGLEFIAVHSYVAPR